MRYLGGKALQGKKIAEIIESTNPARVVVPFCGALNIEVHLTSTPIVESYDACEALATMWQAVQGGWVPPETLTREEWQALRERQDPSDPLTAFAGFGCSYGGKWFAGYTGPDTRWPGRAGGAFAASRSVASKATAPTKVRHRAWVDTCKALRAEDPCTVYCDPPYANTTGYGAVGAFDHVGFFDDCEVLASLGHRVLVTEYANPRGWACCHVFQRRKRMAATTSPVRDELLLQVPSPNTSPRWRQLDLLPVPT